MAEGVASGISKAIKDVVEIGSKSQARDRRSSTKIASNVQVLESENVLGPPITQEEWESRPSFHLEALYGRN